MHAAPEPSRRTLAWPGTLTLTLTLTLTPTPTPTPTLTLTPARASLRAPPPALSRLKFVRDEASMSIDAYKAVFERSLVFGVRKLNQVRRGKCGGRSK